MVYNIRTYKELQDYIGGFAKNKIGFLIIEGAGGTGKTWAVTQSIGKKAVILSGHSTILQLYLDLYKNRNKLIVLDDIDLLLRSVVGISVLKQLAETKKQKKISYHTTSAILIKNKVPQEFTTTGNIILLCNDVRDLEFNQDLVALFSRGVYLLFSPSPKEVFDNISTFGKDQEILLFIKRVLSFVKEINLRHFVVAQQVKDSNLDWKRFLSAELEIPEDVSVVLSIPENLSYAERVKIFTEKTKKSESTYANIVRKIGGR
jgi:hypothetical protein